MLDKKLISYLGKEKKKVFFVAGLDILAMLFNVGLTALACAFLGLLISGNTEMDTVLLYGGLALVGILAKHVLTLGKTHLKHSLASNAKIKLRSDIFNHLMKLGGSAKSKDLAGMTQVSIEGVEQLDLYYCEYLPQFVYAMASPIILFVICAFLNISTALALIICLPLIPMSIVVVSKFAKKVFNKYWDQYTNMGNAFLDNLQGMKELKIFGSDQAKQDYMNGNAENFRKITMKVLFMQLISLTIMDLVAFGGAGIAIVLSLQGGIDGNLSSYMVALFLILISAEFFLPMRGLGSAFHVAMNGVTAGKTILDFLQTPTPNWGDKQLENLHSIEVKDLSFGYTEEKTVLSNINLTFTKGFNGIVGESGCGKSTLVKLITGGVEQQIGNVLINGVPLKEYSQKSFFEKVAVVSCDTFLFHQSIRQNFLLANDQITDEEIFALLDKVNMKEFVTSVGGLDYVIMEESENISGGQKQRFALAINLSQKKDCYILDEATSNIDIESEEIIMKVIEEIAKDSLVLVISHRLQNVVCAKEITLLGDGVVVEQGTHAQLMDKKGGYEKLFTKQKQMENAYKEVQNA